MLGNMLKVSQCLRLRAGVRAHHTDSALYLTGRTASYRTNVVVPEIGPLSLERVKRNLAARQLSDQHDLPTLELSQNYVKWFQQEEERALGQFQSSPDSGVMGKALSDLRAERWAVEEKVALATLALPNDLEEDWCKDHDIDIHVQGSPPRFDFAARCHLELAGDLLEMSNHSPQAFYLLGSLSRLELDLSNRDQDYLRQCDLIPFANPDFAKSVVIEGCGVDFFDPKAEFALEPAQDFQDRQSTQGMHLVGGASIYPFVSFLCKNVVQATSALPATFYTSGRRYRPLATFENRGLFNTQQTTAVELFNFSESHDTMKSQLVFLRDKFIELYDSLDIHYKVVALSAPKLHTNESCKLSFQMYSPKLDEYIEVGSIRGHGQYLSERFMLKAVKDNSQDLQNLYCLSGTVLNITKVLGCLVENSQTEGGNFHIAI
ncbi:serine--tRNA synthetase-like protein Slimp [Tigriopus californicus]|uniref:serine--tRNA synthetase-like protein Slimp n=1 Tax=Tigriopus californicus TaxID=6832 RepID=UPI0027DA929C|nr:serine--tRNA synthetase-like protein Slimp [Tigriopus californicus]